MSSTQWSSCDGPSHKYRHAKSLDLIESTSDGVPNEEIAEKGLTIVVVGRNVESIRIIGRRALGYRNGEGT